MSVAPDVEPEEWEAGADAELRPDLPRGMQGTAPATVPLRAPLAPPDLPARVAEQMAQAGRHLSGGPVEITLNPEELGRVRMHLTAADTGVTLVIVAERPETLDLMRRNIDLLAAEYRGLGYGSLDFTFGQEGAPGRQGAQRGQERSGGTPPPGEITTQPRAAPPGSGSGGLDLRI